MNFRAIVSTVCGAIGGALSWVFGGFDTLMISLIVLMILDYITGVLKGAVKHELSSSTGVKGIAKKVVILILVALAVVVQRSILTSLPIRDMLITFLVANEGLSIIENASTLCPNIVPKWLIKLLEQTKKKAEESEINDSTQEDNKE